MKRMAYLLALLGVSAAAAAQTPKAEFVGVYQKGSVDTVASLAVLPDQTFCFAMIAGALDIYAPGKWARLGQDGTGIRLKFTRVSALPSRFVLVTRAPIAAIAGEEPEEPELLINTASFSILQRDAVFGSSDRPETPGNLAPMFAPGQRVFSPQENLPLTHRYLFLGYPVPEGGWRISRFDIGRPRHSVRLVLSEEAARAGTEWEAYFRNGELTLNDDNMGRPRPFGQGEADAVRKGCLSGAPDDPRVTLFRPQAEYRVDKLSGNPPWFGR
ncbi:MAG: hypothetical protein Q4A62_10600 [Eikenella sp.]|nr:hypothetical protein [Eikenella sp.]